MGRMLVDSGGIPDPPRRSQRKSPAEPYIPRSFEQSPSRLHRASPTPSTTGQFAHRTSLNQDPRLHRNDHWNDNNFDIPHRRRHHNTSPGPRMSHAEERRQEEERERQRQQNRERFSTPSHFHEPRRSFEARRSGDDLLDMSDRVLPNDPSLALRGPRRKKLPREDMERYAPRDRRVEGWDY